MAGVSPQTFLEDLIARLDFPASIDVQDAGSFPLLEIPVRHTSSGLELVADNVSPEVLSQPLVIREMMFDANVAFGSVGGIAICTDTWRPIGYLPNPYILDVPVGSQTYLDLFVDTLAATGFVDQLLARTAAQTTDALRCPLCNAEHDYRHGNCGWDKVLSTTASTHAHPARWTNYYTKTNAILDEFVTTDIPAEPGAAL